MNVMYLNDSIAIPSSLKDELLQQAVAVAMASPSKKRVGSILLNKKRIIAAACNYDKKTHPIQKKYANLACNIHKKSELSQKIYLHSEILCLIRAKEYADTIIIARVGGHGKSKLSNSRPCQLCTLFLKEYGIKKVHYSTPNGFMFEHW
jgi:deoxycytidylate deaminase